MRSLKTTRTTARTERTTRKRLRHTALCSILLTTAITLGFTATSTAQEVEGLAEDQKLEGSTDGLLPGGFGFSVAADDDTIVIGVPFETGDGAAYVYENTPQGWLQTQRLTSNDAADDELLFFGGGDQFGQAVAIDGDTIIVGAPADTNFPDDDVLRALGFIGCCEDDFGFFGAAYVYERDGSDWTETQRLTDADFVSLDSDDNFFVPTSEGFGQAVAIDGDTIAVGAPIGNFNGGTAYVYERTDQAWQSQQALTALPDNSPAVPGVEIQQGFVSFFNDDLFGYSLAVDGDTIVVGAPLYGEIPVVNESFNAETRPAVELGVIGNPNTSANGAAHVFSFDGDQWNEDQRLFGDEEFFEFEFEDEVDFGDEIDFGDELRLLGIETFDGGDQFGYSVDIDTDTIVVGALLEDGETYDEGAAYVFANNGGIWTDVDTLTPLVPESGARFGRSVAIEGDSIVAGSPFGNGYTGAAHLFRNDSESGFEEVELVASDIEAGEGLGFSIALSGGTAVAGAPLNVSLFGVDRGFGGEFFTDTGPGAAYVFDVSAEPPVLCNNEEVTVNLALGDVPTDGDDVILGTDGPDVIEAGAGSDTICGGDGDDTINAGAGDDTVLGGLGDDTINGSGGDDVISGDKGADIINGDSGNDELRGNKGNDTINGGSGLDLLVGSSGNDELRGGKASDTLKGGTGSDTLKGGNADDDLSGGNGADVLDGGVGIDNHNGGGGEDTCVADRSGLNEITERCEL